VFPLNGSTVAGDEVPPGNGAYPSGVAVDPTNGKLFVTTQEGNLVVVNTSTDRFGNLLSLSGDLFDAAYDGANNEVYVTHPYDTSFVLVLNATTDAEIGKVDVGSIPIGVTVDPLDDRIYVANYNSSTVTVINGTNNGIVANVSVPSGPFYLAVDQAAGAVAVTDYEADEVTFINMTTNQVTANVSVGITPIGIAYDPVNQNVYVVNCGPGCITPGGSNGSVYVLNGTSDSFITSIPVGVCPVEARYDSFSNEIIVADSTCTAPSLGNLSVIDPNSNSVVRTVSMGEYPWGVAVDPTSGLVYVTNYYSNNVTIVNGTTWATVAAVGSGEFPSGATVDPRNGVVYVADWGGNDVAVVNGTTGVEVHDLGSWFGPDAVAYANATGDLYVANSESNNVSVFNTSTGKVVTSVAVGADPDGIVYDPTNGNVYVANCDSDNVSIVSAGNETVIGTVTAGVCPKAFTLDPEGNLVMVANRGPLVQVEYVTENVTVISGATNRVTGSIAVGGVPLGIAYDPRNDRIIVENSFSDNLTIINGSTLQLVDSIPLGPSWSYLPSGLAFSSTRNELLIPFLTGVLGVLNASTYRVVGNTSVTWASTWVMVDSPTGAVFVLNPLLGTISVISLSEYPPPTYSVVFREAGLVSGTDWSATFNGTTNESTSNQIVFEVRNGSYTFNMSAPPGYEALTPSGQVNVSGRNETVALTFERLYAVTFTEEGLPGGTPWWVNLTGGPSFAGDGTTIVSAEPNGSYPYSIAAADRNYVASSGTLVVDGAPAYISVLFTELAHEVTFVETGLPAGTTWEVSLNGAPISSTSAWVNFTEVAGAYSFVVGDQFWYDSTPASGQISVAASNQTIQIAFSHVLDQVLFGEGNLPEGINWSATFNGFAEWSTGSGMGFFVANGTYNYSIPSVDGWTAIGITYTTTDIAGLRPFSNSTYTGQLPVYARWVNATLVFNYEPTNTGTGGILGLSEADWAGIVVLVAVVAIVGVIAYRRSRHPVHAPVSPPPRPQTSSRAYLRRGYSPLAPLRGPSTNDWRKAAWFYARFGITEGQFRGGVPTESSGVLDKPRATLLGPSLAGTGALQ